MFRQVYVHVLALGVVLSTPWAYAANPKSKCEILLAGSTVGYDQQLKNLLSAGFKRVDGSPYYRRGGFLIKLESNGGFQLFSNVSEELSSPGSSFVGAKMKRVEGEFEKEKYWYDELYLYFKSGNHYPVRKFGHGRGFSGADKSELPIVRGNNQKQQLLSIGAQQDPQFPSILHVNLLSSDNRTPESFIAIFDGNRLVQLAAKVNDHLISRLAPETEIIGFRLFSNEYHEGLSAIRFRQNSFDFEFSDAHEGGEFVQGSQTVRNDLADVADQAVHLQLPTEDTQANDQKIGGFNVSAWLRRPPAKIWGRTVINNLDTLKNTLRPGQSSTAGFIGADEDLEALLRSDDDHVVKGLGLDHKKLAYPLLKIIAAKVAGFPDEFTYMGHHYRWQEIGWRGMQESPFNDGTGTSFDVILTNLDNGKSVRFSGLLPQLIYRYGFYEGKGTSYRLAPDDIVELLPFLIHGRKTSSSNSIPSPTVGVPSVEAKGTLFQGIKLQSTGGKITMSVEDEAGKKERLEFDKLDSVSVGAGEVIGLKLEQGRESGFLRGTPTLVENSGVLSAIVFDSPEWYSLPVRLGRLKKITITFANPIQLNQFSLSGFHVEPTNEDLAKLARFVEFNYGPQRSKLFYLNIYGAETTKSLPLRLVSATAGDGSITLSLTDGSNSMKLVGTVAEVIPHEKHSEVVLNVKSIVGATFPGTERLRVSFKIDVGHGIFAR